MSGLTQHLQYLQTVQRQMKAQGLCLQCCTCFTCEHCIITVHKYKHRPKEVKQDLSTIKEKSIKFTYVLHFLCSCLALMSINILCFCTSLYLCLCQTLEIGLWKDYISVSRCSYTPDCCDSCGSTPLMDALRTGHVLVAETLIKEHKVQESNMKV